MDVMTRKKLFPECVKKVVCQISWLSSYLDNVDSGWDIFIYEYTRVLVSVSSAWNFELCLSKELMNGHELSGLSLCVSCQVSFVLMDSRSREITGHTQIII